MRSINAEEQRFIKNKLPDFSEAFLSLKCKFMGIMLYESRFVEDLDTDLYLSQKKRILLGQGILKNPLSSMKTNRQNYTEKSSVRIDESEQNKSALTAVKSLPAVRPFSNVPVQKKAEQKAVVQEEEISSTSSVSHFIAPPSATMLQQPPVQGGFFSGLKDKIFGKKQEAEPEETEMTSIPKTHDMSELSQVAPTDDYFDDQQAKPEKSRWDKFKSGAKSFAFGTVGGGLKSFGKYVGKKLNSNTGINTKNTALGSAVPIAMAGSSISDAVKVGNTGKINQDASLLGGLGGIAAGTANVGLGGFELGKGIATKDARRGILGAADFASGGLSVASGALSIAGTTGSAIPGLGIASAGLDTLVQGGKGIYAHTQMNKLAAMQSRIQGRNAEQFGKLSPGEGYTGDLKKQYALLNIAKEAMDVRRKQRNRAGINAVGSAIETAGHSTVVGAGVTGIGAAVGMGLVAGGKGIKALAGLVRGAKQKMIDKGWVGKGKEDERTTENKEKRAKAFVDNVIENHDDPDVHEAMDALGANKEQLELLKAGKLPRPEIYKLYKAR